jgi:hypothetical protein
MQVKCLIWKLATLIRMHLCLDTVRTPFKR